MKTLIKNLSVLALSSLMASCGAVHMAVYDIGLNKVESPANAREQFGETKVLKFVDGEQNKYRYEDDYINIVWYVGPTQFNFELTNKSQHTLKINWDDISYVDSNGQTGRVMHSGIKYTDRNNSQPATSVPRGAKISDILLPTENVSLNSSLYSTGWKEANLIPSFYSSKKYMMEGAPKYLGKTLKILMPIMIQNVQNDYIFEFSVDEWINKK